MTRRRVITVLSLALLLLAGLAASTAFTATETTGTATACATVTAPTHSIGVDGNTLTTVGGEVASQCETSTYTVPTVTSTAPGTTETITSTATQTVTVTSTTPAPSTPGWTNIVDDQFDSGGIPSHWILYNGRDNVGGNCFAPSQETVSGGYLHLKMNYLSSGTCGADWYTGGMALLNTAPYAVSDQRVTVRWRVVPNGVTSHRIIPMRWVAGSTSSNGEEDFCEGHSNSACTTFIHYGSSFVSHGYALDLTQWHTMRFVQDHLQIRAFIDDLSTPVWVQNYDSTVLPTLARKAVLQQECWPLSAGGCPPGTTGSEEIQVDWITVDNSA